MEAPAGTTRHAALHHQPIVCPVSPFYYVVGLKAEREGRSGGEEAEGRRRRRRRRRRERILLSSLSNEEVEVSESSRSKEKEGKAKEATLLLPLPKKGGQVAFL